MIILHNQHDKDSRDFVEKYGQGNEVIEYPECIEHYPNISAFPSVVIDVPEYTTPAQKIPALDQDGNAIIGEDGNPIPPFEVPETTIPAHIEIFRSKDDPCDPDVFWGEIQDYLTLINERAK